jgi:hypothetical protein
MTRAGKSMFYFSFWVFLCGIALMFLPAWTLAFLDIHLSDYIAVRLFGMVLLFNGIYYVVVSRHSGCLPFIKATVYTRGTAMPAMAVFVLLGLAKPIVISFVVVDALGAFWTWRALKNDKKAEAAG